MREQQACKRAMWDGIGQSPKRAGCRLPGWTAGSLHGNARHTSYRRGNADPDNQV